jgi:hypothetical protein
VKPKFGISMPGTKDEEHVHNQGIVVFIWKEVLEYWN